MYTPVSCISTGACVCAPYVKCCVGSVTARAGHEPYLLYLPRISKYSYVTLVHEERSRTYLYARLQHALVSSLTLVDVGGRMNVAGHVEKRASDTRGACWSAGKRARLPPVKPAGAVVPLCCGTLRRKGRINPVVRLGITVEQASKKRNPWLTRTSSNCATRGRSTLTDWQKVIKPYSIISVRKLHSFGLRLCA